MYTIIYRFGKRLQAYVALCEQDRDHFLDTLKKFEIKILAVRFRLC